MEFPCWPHTIFNFHFLKLSYNRSSSVLFLLIGFRGQIDLTRSWLLPVLRDNIEKAELSFFASFFLPLASQLKAKCK